jgi:hypothetical protein
MEIKDNFIKFKNILPKDYLDKISDYTLNLKDWDKTNKGVRRINYLDKKLLPDTKLMLDNYLKSLSPIESYQFQLQMQESGGYSEDCKVSKYTKGGEFDWHLDSISYYPSNPNWRRILTTITYLNDDYIGGETEILNKVTIKPKKYSTLIFPSGIPYIHKGLPVIKGTKYLLVNHLWT